tara:strand:- start:2352 stop:2573 length:222 start_codon:yes stop_codon:yes gene_type:complete
VRSSIENQRQYRRNYYLNNKEKLKQYQKEYYKNKKRNIGIPVKQVNRKCNTSWKGPKNPLCTIEYGEFVVSFD